MMTVVSLLLILAGIGFVVGAKDFAGGVLKGAIGAVLVFATLPCLLKACCCNLVERDSRPTEAGMTRGIWIGLVLTVLSVTGFVAWRRRSDAAKAREILARRHGSSRPRALPPPAQPQDRA